MSVALCSTALATTSLLSLATAASASASSTWGQLFPTASPGARSAAAMTYDDALGSLVFFGGRGASGPTNDTWTFANSQWTHQSPPSPPSARDGASMAYDPLIDKVVLFGGENSLSQVNNETWLFDSATKTWTAAVLPGGTSAPPARRFASMAFDPVIGVVVLFGGETNATTQLSDTWIFDGVSWTQLSPAAPPAPRSGASMTFDPALGQLVLFGGANTGGTLGDTWTYDGQSWTSVPGATHPSPRAVSSMDYDAAAGRLILFGGFTGPLDSAETWTFDGSSWSQVLTASHPIARRLAAASFDPASSQLIVFGGQQGSALLGDTWNYGVNAVAPDAPAISSLTPGDSQIAVSWSAPGSDGGSAITSYTATATDGVNLRTCSAVAAGCTITGLTNGVSYSVSVVATNAVGDSPPSATSLSTPSATPGAPTLSAIAPGDGALSVAWNAPLSDGGSSITGYTASAIDGANTFRCTTATLTCDVSGLTDGVSYAVSVVATNAQGDSAPSLTANATPRSVPGSPVPVSLVPGDGSIAATWSAPITDGGAPITSYTATATDGTTTRSCTTVTMSCSVHGLTNGSTFEVGVVATNAAGDSASADAGAATPATTPGAPTILGVVRANAAAGVNWSVPTFDGGSAITGYTASATDGATTMTCTTTQHGCFISGLTNGVSYSVSVVATNATGNSASSLSASVTPFTTPDTPVIGTITSGDGTLSVAWSAPGDGGSAISGYSVDANDGVHHFACATALLTCTLTGLTNGVSYSVSLVATNSAGPSGTSVAVPATPFTKAGAPTMHPLLPGNGVITVAWGAPANNGGSPVTSYRATASDGVHSRSCTSASTNCTITGLTNNVNYAVHVVAVNGAGDSAPSSVAGAFPTSTKVFLAYPAVAVVLAGHGAKILVARAPAGASVQVTLGAAHGLCVASSAGQCAATIKATPAGVLSVTGHYSAAGKSVTSAATHQLAASVTVSPATVKKGQTAQVHVAFAVPGSTVTVSGGPVKLTTKASATGSATLTVTTTKVAKLTLVVADGAVMLATLTLTVTA